MSESVLHPLWNWLADIAISILAYLPVIALTFFLLGRTSGDFVIGIFLAGGLFAAFHVGIKLFAHSVILRICQNIAVKFAPIFRQFQGANYITFFTKIICLLGVLSLIGLLLTFYLQTYYGGKDANLDAKLVDTFYYTTRVSLVSIPFILFGLVYLAKIKPILPPPVEVQTIGGQQGTIEEERVEVFD